MYSAFDLKDRRYFSTGRNSRSYRECIEAVKSLLKAQYSEDMDDLPDKKVLKMFNVRIDRHVNRADNGTDALLADIVASYVDAKRGIRRKRI